MKILHLTLRRKWFLMILSGEKKEEYRDMKPYWINRLFEEDGTHKQFDIIRFTNGYGKRSPAFDIEYKSICFYTGKKEWGAPDDYVIVISLGAIIALYNISSKKVSHITN